MHTINIFFPGTGDDTNYHKKIRDFDDFINNNSDGSYYPDYFMIFKQFFSYNHTTIIGGAHLGIGGVLFGSGTNGIVQKVIAEIKSILRPNKSFKLINYRLNIFGISRGCISAMNLLYELQNKEHLILQEGVGFINDINILFLDPCPGNSKMINKVDIMQLTHSRERTDISNISCISKAGIVITSNHINFLTPLIPIFHYNTELRIEQVIGKHNDAFSTELELLRDNMNDILIMSQKDYATISLMLYTFLGISCNQQADSGYLELLDQKGMDTNIRFMNNRIRPLLMLLEDTTNKYNQLEHRTIFLGNIQHKMMFGLNNQNIQTNTLTQTNNRLEILKRMVNVTKDADKREKIQLCTNIRELCYVVAKNRKGKGMTRSLEALRKLLKHHNFLDIQALIRGCARERVLLMPRLSCSDLRCYALYGMDMDTYVDKNRLSKNDFKKHLEKYFSSDF